MRQLTKIKLINWHYFSNETIPIEESALITGDNGAGKSTLIDAIQVVMIANMKKIKFNSSAFDEKTTRDLKGYLRGKTGSEGRNTYRRGEDDFSSYIVLEITHAKTGKQYLIGAVFDYFSGSGEEQHVFFKVDEQALVDDLFFEADVARNKQKFFHNLKVNGINHKQYANDIEGYRYDLRQLFGGVKESFFSLFSKGISFSPLTNLRSFVYDYILEERPVYVDTMRDYFEKFRQMENIIQDTNTEIECLERISRAFGEVENLRAQAEAGRYMRYRGSWEQNVRDLEKEKQELSATEARLEKLHLDLEQLEKRRQRL